MSAVNSCIALSGSALDVTVCVVQLSLFQQLRMIAQYSDSHLNSPLRYAHARVWYVAGPSGGFDWPMSTCRDPSYEAASMC